MSLFVLSLPFIGVVLLGLLLSVGLSRVDPIRSARYAYGFLVLSCMTALPVGAYLVVGFVAQLPVVGNPLHDLLHSRDVHTSSTGWIGVVALLVLILGGVRTGVLMSTRKRLIDACGTDEVVVVESETMHAFAMPGPSRTIVVSSAITEVLTSGELDVVLAHERAHVRLRHDRALLVGQICIAFLPFMRPLAARLEYALERIADEAAVGSCGDRDLVARTLAKTALFDQPPRVAMGISRRGVTGRVLSLWEIREPKSNVIEAIVPTALSVALALSCLQWHHVVSAARVICGV